jgi:hypothetical protein
MKTVYLALGLLLLPGMLWAQGSEKENEFTMSMQIRPRAEYRNGAQLPRFEGDKAASFINNRARLSMEYKRSDLSMKISAQHVGVAHVAGVVVFLLVSFQMRLHLLYCTHRQGNSNELAALFSVNALGRGNDGFIRIFAHAAKIMQTEERTFMLA